MYKRVFIPSEQNCHIIIPHRWYGKEVEVTIKEKPKAKKATLEDTWQQQVDFSDIEQALMSNDNDFKEIHDLFEPYQFSFKNFKFDRNEANNYE